MNEAAYTLIGTLFGFFLFLAWELYKDRKEEARQKRKVIAILYDEANRNLYSCKKNQEILSHELIAIEETQTESVITPVNFSTSSWQIAKSGDVFRFLDNSTIESLSQLYQALEWMNLILQNREITRAASKQLREYPVIIKAYNKRLYQMMSDLRPEIEKMVTTMKNLGEDT